LNQNYNAEKPKEMMRITMKIWSGTEILQNQYGQNVLRNFFLKQFQQR